MDYLDDRRERRGRYHLAMDYYSLACVCPELAESVMLEGCDTIII